LALLSAVLLVVSVLNAIPLAPARVYAAGRVSVSTYQAFSSAIEQAMRAHQAVLYLTIYNYNQTTYNINTTVEKVINAYPQVYYAYGGWSMRGTSYSDHADIDITFTWQNLADLGSIVTVNTYPEFYSALKTALRDVRSRILLQVNNYNSATYDIGSIINKLEDDDPDIDFIKTTWHSTYGEGTNVVLKIEPEYYYTRDQILSMRAAVDGKVAEVIGKVVSPGMADYEKELALHDYIVNNARYDEVNYEANTIPELDYTAYGVLIKGTGVCEGYAKATKKLLNAAGIETLIVGGTSKGEGHAWNLVKIQGEYYQLDTTWDDPVTSGSRDVLEHDYFNVTDAILARDHSWDRSAYPAATGTMYSYANILKLPPTPPVDKPESPPAATIRTVSVTLGQVDPVRGLDVPAYVYAGRTMVPLRFISESLGGQVEYLAATDSVDIQLNGQFVHIQINNRYATVNSYPLTLMATPVARSGRLFVGLRDLGNLLGGETTWDEVSKTATITLP
jgi:transglutaminase-like putative cysteine protease